MRINQNYYYNYREYILRAVMVDAREATTEDKGEDHTLQLLLWGVFLSLSGQT
jgi:hypothetical protein